MYGSRERGDVWKMVRDLALALWLMVVEMIAAGFTLWMLWGWFALPVFDVAVDLLQAIGLMVIVKFVIAKYERVNTENLDWGATLTGAFGVPILFLIVGWVIHLMIG